MVLALGYFAAEVWHGASRRTWLLARVSAGVALLGPVILWLLRYPLCAIADVESVNKGSQACHGNPGNLVITPSTAALAVVAIVTLIVIVWLLVDLGRPRPGGRALDGRDLLPLVATAAVGGAALAVSRLLPDQDPLFTFNGIVPELLALVAAVPLGLIAIQVVTARDARRFVAGLVAAAAAWFVVLYPNISALPMPSTVVNAYQGLLPTYLYAVPVRREHGRPQRGHLLQRPEVLHPAGVPRRRLRGRRLRRVGLAPGARGAGGRGRSTRGGPAGEAGPA